ncbi:hypothetical protein PZH44_15205, partial [Alistipes putredinis]|uniref:hypothetical protein n=1 Tax=Alistipes putredinis TaxID=28117 RepID=UPI0023AFE25E
PGDTVIDLGSGAWRIEGDTVILWSPDFSIVLDSVFLPYGPRCWPNLNKYTDATENNQNCLKLTNVLKNLPCF